MEIKRKVFSVSRNENGEEKLFSVNELISEEKLYSTGNEELDELLERAFSEGYECAQKEFGMKERREKRKADKKKLEELKEYGVSRSDRESVETLQNMSDKNKERYSRLNSEDRAVRDDQDNKNKKRSYPLLTGIGTGVGASYGYAIGGSGKSAAIGAAVGAGIGTLGAAALHKHNKNLSRKAEEYKGGKTDKEYERTRDLMALEKNKMSASDFAEKWGKYDKKHKDDNR